MTRRIRGGLAALLLLAAVVGLPAALAATIGNPLTGWPELSSGRLTSTGVLAVLAAVFYLAWASFLIPLLIEAGCLLTARLTRRPVTAPRLPGLGPQQQLARATLGAVLALLPTGASSAGPTSTPPPPPVMRPTAAVAPLRAATPAPSETHRATESTPPTSYTVPAVGGPRSWWALAEHLLGDGQRWRELWHANQGTVQPDGSRLDHPERLRAGWVLRIPGAPGHAVTVRPGDTLSGLAAADGVTDWHRVWPANRDRPEPDGRRLTDPNLILPGWTVQLPDHQATAAPRTAGTRPPLPTGPGRTGRPPAAQRVAPPPPPRAPAPDTAPGSPTPTPTPPPAGHDRLAVDRAEPSHQPLPLPLELGLAALATVAVLDRARRIAQRRRRPGHRRPPAPAPLRQAEAQLRQQAARATGPAAAVALAAALTTPTPPDLRAVLARDNGTVDLLLADPTLPPPAPFVATAGGWRLPTDAASYTAAVDDAADPYPGLVPLGRHGDAALLVDLLAAGVVGIAGDRTAVDTLIAGIVTALAGAPWADRLTLHVPPRLADLAAICDRVRVASTPAVPPVMSTAPPADPMWDTRPLHLFAGWRPDDPGVADLVARAGVPGRDVAVLLTGLVPGAARWTLHAGLLTVPDLPDPVTVTAAGQRSDPAAAAALVRQATSAPDVPVGDPALPDLAAEAPPAPEPAGPVQLNLLGPVELVGAPAPERGVIINLLVYLALHRRGTDRDQLSTALSPDEPMTAKTLRNRITEARALVGGAISDGPRWRLADTVTTDWQRFTALAAGSRAEQREALELVRGRPFAGLDGANWIDLDGYRTEVEAAIVDVALRVAESELDDGNPAAAYRAARAGLRASRYEERLHRLALRAAHAEGATGKVRALAHEMRIVLDEDIEPADTIEPDTLAVYEEVTTTQGPEPGWVGSGRAHRQ